MFEIHQQFLILKIILTKELSTLLAELKSIPKNEFEKWLLDEQKIAESHINSRPGAMAFSTKHDSISSMNIIKNIFNPL